MPTLEQMRAAAKVQPGVSYDERAGKFVARMMVRGQRRYLGFFATAEEAGAAYLAARGDEPVMRKRGGGSTVDEAFQLMLETADRNEKGFLIPGAACFELDHTQFFILDRVDYRKAKPGAGRKRWIWWIWKSECILCRAEFEVKIRMGVRHLHGITRTCELHRGVKGEPWSLAPKDELLELMRTKKEESLV